MENNMATLTELKDSDLVGLYIQLRDRRAQRKAAYEHDDATDKGKQERIEGELLRRFQERGADSVSAKGIGTAYKSVRSTASVADWDSFLGYVRENEAWELIAHSCAKSSVQEFKAANDDLPPGISWREEVVVNVRRS
jgi:hypothetical protein